MSLKSKVKTSGLLAGLLAVPFLLAPALTNASVPATAKVNTTKLKVDDKFVYVGQLHSATGTMAISETGSIQAERLPLNRSINRAVFSVDRSKLFRKMVLLTGQPLQKKHVNCLKKTVLLQFSAAGLQPLVKPYCRLLNATTLYFITQPSMKA
jgi:hypothetical protein